MMYLKIIFSAKKVNYEETSQVTNSSYESIVNQTEDPRDIIELVPVDKDQGKKILKEIRRFGFLKKSNF